MSCLTPEKQNTLSVNQDKASPASPDPLVIHWAVKPLLTVISEAPLTPLLCVVL